MKKKKKILVHSNHCRAKTGFGKHVKHLLTYLYKTNKYEIVEFSNGKQWNDPSLSTLPWKCIGSLPIDVPTIQEAKSTPENQRRASYGHFKIDDAIKEEKPDIYLGIEDIWGLNDFWKKTWWNKINSIIWTPVDSLPLLDKHVNAIKNTENIIVQASFAQNEFEKQGYKNSHLMPVPIDTDNFFRLDDENRSKLRINNNISEEDFIIGFVFRNQLRKSVPNLLDGFKKFKSENPESNAKLLLHTHWSEGWDIPKLLAEKSINQLDVLTTYFCDNCKQYEIKPFTGQDLDCKFCGTKKSQQTTQISRGVSESQLNQVYNLMDVYCHPFTSGGQEIPIQEAKLTGLITLVTNYSCGEDYSSKESGGLPLNWNEYREPGTQFIKASTCSEHIKDQLSKVWNMRPKEKVKMGKLARDFVIDFCSIESVCSRFENLISEMKPTSWDFDFSYVKKDPTYKPNDIEEDKEWLVDLYKNILKVEDPERDDPEGINHWLKILKEPNKRQSVYEHIVKVAVDENSKNHKIPFNDLLSKDDEGKRILFVLPGNQIDVFNSTSLLKYIKEKYPSHNIYYATEKNNFSILNGNPYVFKTVLYDKIMENFLWGEGQNVESGMFDFVIKPHSNTHGNVNYIHGQKHKPEYDIYYA